MLSTYKTLKSEESVRRDRVSPNASVCAARYEMAGGLGGGGGREETSGGIVARFSRPTSGQRTPVRSRSFPSRFSSVPAGLLSLPSRDSSCPLSLLVAAIRIFPFRRSCRRARSWTSWRARRERRVQWNCNREIRRDAFQLGSFASVGLYASTEYRASSLLRLLPARTEFSSITEITSPSSRAIIQSSN